MLNHPARGTNKSKPKLSATKQSSLAQQSQVTTKQNHVKLIENNANKATITMQVCQSTTTTQKQIQQRKISKTKQQCFCHMQPGSSLSSR